MPKSHITCDKQSLLNKSHVHCMPAASWSAGELEAGEATVAARCVLVQCCPRGGGQHAASGVAGHMVRWHNAMRLYLVRI